MIPTLGEGEIWNLPTIIFTAVLAVAVCAWMIYVLCRVTPDETDLFYGTKSIEKENQNGYAEN